MVLIVICCLIIVVSLALWRAQNQQRRAAPVSNRYQKKAKKKKTVAKQKPNKTRADKSAAPASRSFTTETVNLHHEAMATDDVAASDDVLGVSNTEAQPLSTPLALYLAAPANQPFNGFSLLQSILASGLRINKDGAFEAVVGSNTTYGALTFVMGSMKEPGTFNMDTMSEYQTPGLVFFIEGGLPASILKQVYSAMTACMEKIQAQIGGNIFTQDKILLEGVDVARYCDYLCDLIAEPASAV
jgi:FtsZ-interacting cell division protein ZipA